MKIKNICSKPILVKGIRIGVNEMAEVGDFKEPEKFKDLFVVVSENKKTKEVEK